MGWGRAGLVGLATIVLGLVGCGQEDQALRGTYVQVEPDGKGLGGTSTTTRKILFINPCRGGCFVEPGADDSIRNRSRIVRFPVNFPEFPHEDHIWAETLECVRRLYEPFEIEVTDVDPGTTPHSENIVAGTARLAGLDDNIGGIAPLACGGLYGVISFTFAQSAGPSVPGLCHTIGQETAHSFGLDHQLLCDDPMTYLPDCGEKAFQRIDARCGEDVPRPCLCGEPFQNSHLALLGVLGPRTTPLVLPPFVHIVEPDGKTPVFPGFRTHIEARDDSGITQVELSIDGRSLGIRTVPPYVFDAPLDLPLGFHDLLAVGTNRGGTTSQDTVRVELVVEPPRRDAGVLDRGFKPPEPDPIYTRDGGSDSGVVRTLGESGCGCSTGQTQQRASLLLLALLAAVLLLRKRGWIVLSLLILACEDDSRFGDASGELLITPPPPTLLDFGPVILGRANPSAIILRVKNEGTGVLRLEQPFFEGDGAEHFLVTIWPQDVAPQKTRDIFIKFDPQAVFQGQATLVIPNSDRNQPEVRYPVTGDARAPCRLRSNREWVTFKLEETHPIELIARGTSDCTIVRLGLDRRLFTLIDPPELPIVVPAGQSMTLQVKHTARTTRLGLPVRQLQLDEADGSTLVVNLEGQEPVFDCASVYPSKIEFEDGDEGVAQRRRAIVSNRCDENLRILSAGANGLAYEADETPPINVPPRGEASVWVTYKPVFEDGDRGQFVIRTDDVKNTSFVIELEGHAKIPRPVVLPAVSFGSVSYRQPSPLDGRSQCASRLKNIPIFNAGSGGLLVSSIVILGDSPAFEIIGADIDGAVVDPTQPFVIPGWSVGHVKVELRPTRRPDADQFAELIIGHSETREASKVLLSGRSVSDVPVVDRFVEPAQRGIDLLIVVDDSASMVTPQQRLMDASGTLLAELDRPRISLQTAVTWSDEAWPLGGWTSRCPPHPSVLPSSYADLATRQFALACALAVGDLGREPAAGLGAAMRSIEHAIAPPSLEGVLNPLMGFLRPDAQLAVLVVSDEEDQSKESLSLLHGFFQGIKGLDRPDLISVHGIVGPESRLHCLDTSPWVQAGTRVAWMSDRTGGTRNDICAQDYLGHFQTIARSLSGRDPHYPLSRAADAGSIEVFVNGVSVPHDPIDGYFHDLRTNVVRLSGGSRPDPGETVEIRYSDLCRP